MAEGSSAAPTGITHQVDQPKILVIGDRRACQEPGWRALAQAGFEITTHEKSVQAILAIMNLQPDLIILSLRFPLTDELMISQLIRRNQMIAAIPILLYSSFNETLLQQQIPHLTAQGYIHKSWQRDRIIARLKETLS